MGTYSGVFTTPSTTPKSNQPQVQQPGLYSGIFDQNGVKQTGDQQQSVWDYFKNLGFNSVKTGAVLNLLDPTLFRGDALGRVDPQTAQKLMTDVPKLFDSIVKLGGSGGPIEIAARLGAKVATDNQAPQADNGFGTLGNLAVGFTKPISDYMELQSGLQLTGNDVQALTPEEKAARIKSSVGLLAATAVGGPLAKVLPVGTLGQRMLANVTVGTAAGATYGAVAGAGDQDQLSQIIQNGIFGGGFGLIGGTLGEIHKILFGRSAGKTKPEEIAQIRSLVSPDNSLVETTSLAKSLVSSNDLAEALLTGKVGLQPNDIHIIPGVDPATLFRLNAKLPEGYRSALHIDDSGVGRLLVYDENLIKNEPYVRKETVTNVGESPEETLANWNKEAEKLGKGTPGISREQETYETGTKEDRFVYRDSEGNPLGVVKLLTTKSGSVAINSHVNPNNYRQGIATRLYAAAEAAGFKPEESSKYEPKTTTGQAFYEGRQAKKLSVNGEKFFEKNGLVQGQKVSYLGKENWEVIDAAKDGGIKLKNVLDGSEVVANKNDIRLPESMNIINKHEAIIDRLYGEWKDGLQPTDEKAKANADAYSPIGMDDVPPDSFVDRVPELEGFNTAKTIDDFLNSRNFTGDDFINLKRELQLKLSKEAFDALPIEDQDLINKAKQQSILDNIKTGREKIKDYNSLQRYAKSNGFRISEGGSGRYIIRALDDHKILTGADNFDEAKKWIDKAGQAKGPDLDGTGTSIDNNIASGGLSLSPDNPPKTPFDSPWDYSEYQFGTGKWESLYRVLDNFPLITRYRDFMSHLDSKYNTDFTKKIHEKLNNTRNIRNNLAKPWIKEWETLRRSFSGGEKEAKLIKDYIETMSPEQVISGFMKRPMNPTEINLARFFAGSKVDLEAVFKYRREIERLNGEYPEDIRGNDPQKNVEYQQQKMMAQKAYKIDDNGIKVANFMDAIEETPKDQASLGAIVRLARALDNGMGQRELTRAEFAVKNKMTLDQLNHASQIEGFYNRLAKAFGVNPDRQLGGYTTHANLYYDNDVPKAIKYFSGDIKTKDFYAKLSRTGEISATETNAFRGLLRYIKAGFDVNSGFADALRQARADLEKELVGLEGGSQAKVRKVLNQYIDDMQGMPEAGDRASKTAIDYLRRQWGMNLDEGTIKNWTTAMNSLVNAGALGARPMLGIGHFGISNIISLAARDKNYTGRMLANGAKVIVNYHFGDGSMMAELQAKGVFQGLSPFSVMRADVEPGFVSKAGHAVDKIQEGMFKTTLLPTVYDGMAAGHYLTTVADVQKALMQLDKGEITSKQFLKDTFIRRYDLPIQKRFMELAKDFKNPSRIADAAHYLGMNAIEDLVGTYGSGNTPYLWGTNAGRIVGQFGNYAMWIRGVLERLVSRGTIGDRIGAAAKIGGAAYLTHKASEETGIDITRLSPIHAVTWMFGPLVHIAEDAMDAMHTNGYQQQQAIGRLKRVLPIDSDGNIHPSIFIPGSFAVDGIVQAADDFSKGNVGTGVAHAAGLRNFQGGNKKPTF